MNKRHYNKLYFLTFANKDYMSTDRISNQIKQFGMFDHIIQTTEDDIKEFILKHSDFIRQYNKVGYGMWIWKPKIIFDLLNKINDNDVLVYLDCGMYANIKGLERFCYYLDKLKNYSLVTFSSPTRYIAQQYVKMDAIMHYYPEFNKEWNIYKYAGIMLIKKNDSTLTFIKDWLNLCENYHFLDRSPSINYKEASYYSGNDCDNGLFNLCLSKHSHINFSIEPDEINITNQEGIQLEHFADKRFINKYSWEAFDKIPFQCRRLVPGKNFGYHFTSTFDLSELQNNISNFLTQKKNTILEINPLEGNVTTFLGDKFLDHKDSILVCTNLYQNFSINNDTEKLLLENINKSKNFNKIFFKKFLKNNFLKNNTEKFNFIIINSFGDNEENIEQLLLEFIGHLTDNGIVWINCCYDNSFFKRTFLPIVLYLSVKNNIEIIYSGNNLAFKKTA